VETAKDARERIMIQTELEEAGFELLALKKRLLLASANDDNANTDDVRLEQLLQVRNCFFFLRGSLTPYPIFLATYRVAQRA
jgi:hypothetical protein